jgi:hypothetical protein
MKLQSIISKRYKTYSKNLQRGFTITEMLLYMGLLTILVGILGSIFGSIIDTQLESNALSNVDQDGRYIMAKLIYDFHASQSITTPTTPGQQTSSLQIIVNSQNYTYSLNNSNLQLVNNLGTNQLNSIGSTVSNLSFLRIGTGDNNDTVKVRFTLTSSASRTKGPEIRNFETTLSGINMGL